MGNPGKPPPRSAVRLSLFIQSNLGIVLAKEDAASAVIKLVVDIPTLTFHHIVGMSAPWSYRGRTSEEPRGKDPSVMPQLPPQGAPL